MQCYHYYDYRYLAWANCLYTVQVKSILATKPPLRLGASAANNRLMTIALFRVHPLELQTCFPIEKHVRNSLASRLYCF